MAQKKKIYITQTEYDNLLEKENEHEFVIGDEDFNDLTVAQQEVLMNDLIPDDSPDCCDIVITNQDPYKMDRTTIRLPHYLKSELDSYARKNNCALADIVRWSCTAELSKHLKSVYFVDYLQGKEIQDSIIGLTNTVAGLTKEIHRIGNNLNQLTRTFNISAKENRSISETDLREYKSCMTDVIQVLNSASEEVNEAQRETWETVKCLIHS